MALLICFATFVVVLAISTLLQRRQQARMYAAAFGWSDARLLALGEEHLRARVRLERLRDEPAIHVFLQRLGGQTEVFCFTVSATPTGYCVRVPDAELHYGPLEVVENINRWLRYKASDCDRHAATGGVGRVI